MDKLLKDLLEAEILTTETAKELQESISAQVTEAIELAKAEATATVTAQLNEQWITERDILIETLDEKVTEVLVAELAELKEDVERFRDLEAEFAEKLVEEKHGMASKLEEELDLLVQRIDAVVEIRLAQELNELKEDITETRKNSFGRKIFEAYVAEFKAFQVADDSIEGKLQETEQRLADAMIALESAETANATMVRTQKLRSVLSPLTGRNREVMEAILRTVDTNLLEDAYATYIGRILKESSVDDISEKEVKVLAEGTESKDSRIKGVVKTGDDATQLSESEDLDKRETSSAPIQGLSVEARVKLRSLAGL